MRRLSYVMQAVTVFLMIVLVGCGSTGGSGGVPGSSGTSTAQPVNIQTDRSTYAPTDSIKVLVTNNLQDTIYAFDTRASCSILDMQAQINGTWQASSVARCPLGRPAMRVAIQPGHTYTATIQAGYAGISSAAFPPGSHRFLLSYSTSATSLPQQYTMTIYSTPITVGNS